MQRPLRNPLLIASLAAAFALSVSSTFAAGPRALPEGKLPIDPPAPWPQRYTIAHWAVLIEGLPEGKYYLRCRTIDANGLAQPMPRPFPKSGRNSIQRVPITVTSA